MVSGDGHPYSPAELELPGFVPQRLSQGEILAPFLGASLLVALAVWLVSGRCGCRSSKTERLLMCWWAFTGLTHILLAGAFLFTPDIFSRENPSYFDELFKEFSKGDSRYAARDTAILALEVVTIGFKGPASLLAVYAIATRKSCSDILQFAVCLGQLFGCLLYFVTAYLAGFNFWASPFYFWAYFVGANSSWVVVPTLIAVRSWKKISAAFQAEKVKTG
ncbi:putative 3-beta-hydroxysteroid-Delta(8),Delta(7)-isomerase [Panicum miliaceum]|uniref:3-beta-hydroxysteroid-Delta(8),Delta(7)-isomerase n=1 Tax=Panicum miliaceum TaxID=4540 RepID=A0A3L6SSY8_PANMI|nr:putative 3-beta-hydroxysteroid-Delta(8),Delta(7)-isomerase [Panicum miliaceum]